MTSILKTSGADAMKKIIDDALPLVDFLWQITNNNFLVGTPGGRAQAEKFLKKELEKITDPDLKSEFDKEYNKRKFNSWHRWKRNESNVQIKLPDIDSITKNTLIYIVNAFPELAERYLDFLGTLGIDFNANAPELNLDSTAAEKYIVSLKLQRHLAKLNAIKKELTNKLLAGENIAREEITKIDEDIAKFSEKLEILISI